MPHFPELIHVYAFIFLVYEVSLQCVCYQRLESDILFTSSLILGRELVLCLLVDRSSRDFVLSIFFCGLINKLTQFCSNCGPWNAGVIKRDNLNQKSSQGLESAIPACAIGFWSFGQPRNPSIACDGLSGLSVSLLAVAFWFYTLQLVTAMVLYWLWACSFWQLYCYKFIHIL